MWMDFVQRRPARPTRDQPRATPWVNNGVVDCALTGQKHYDGQIRYPRLFRRFSNFVWLLLSTKKM